MKSIRFYIKGSKSTIISFIKHRYLRLKTAIYNIYKRHLSCYNNGRKIRWRKKGANNMATKTASVLARIEPDVKMQAEEVMERLGVPASVVINMLYKQIILTQSIPFSLSLTKRLLARNEMNKAEFDAMMSRGCADALAGRHEDVDKVFDAIDMRIDARG